VVRPTLIELAVRVLRAAIERAKVERIDAPDVRLALRCLLPHVTHRQLLVELWAYVFSPGIWWIGLTMNRSGSDVQILAMYS
jgi:hypothetical protein